MRPHICCLLEWWTMFLKTYLWFTGSFFYWHVPIPKYMSYTNIGRWQEDFFGMFCGHVVWAGSQQNSFPGVRPCFNTTEVHVFNKVFNGNLSHCILSIKRLIVCVLVNVFKPNWASLHQFMVQMFKRNVKHLNWILILWNWKVQLAVFDIQSTWRKCVPCPRCFSQWIILKKAFWRSLVPETKPHAPHVLRISSAGVLNCNTVCAVLLTCTHIFIWAGQRYW